MSSITESIKSAVHSLAHPGQPADSVNPIEHPAHHGASFEHQEPGQPVLSRLWSPETTRQIKSQGNNGVGMEDGLRSKAIEQQERVAERSRLRQEGLFEPHTKHDEMTNLTTEHREVADGSKVEIGK